MKWDLHAHSHGRKVLDSAQIVQLHPATTADYSKLVNQLLCHSYHTQTEDQTKEQSPGCRCNTSNTIPTLSVSSQHNAVLQSITFPTILLITIVVLIIIVLLPLIPPRNRRKVHHTILIPIVVPIHVPMNKLTNRTDGQQRKHHHLQPSSRSGTNSSRSNTHHNHRLRHCSPHTRPTTRVARHQQDGLEYGL